MFSLALLSGGTSSRMGSEKGLMPFLGRPLIMRIRERLAPIVDEVIISTKHSEHYTFLELPIYPDILPGLGALGGLYSSIHAAHNPFVAAVACDMPFANPTLFEFEFKLLSQTNADVAIPSIADGLEPLHAVYRRETCLPVIQSFVEAGKLKMVGWLQNVKIRIIQPEERLRYDPDGLAFWNLNTPEEFKKAEEKARSERI